MSVFDSISPVANPITVDRDWSRLNTTELRRAYGTTTVSNILHDRQRAPAAPTQIPVTPLPPEEAVRPVEVEAQEPSAYSASRNAQRQRDAVEVTRLPISDMAAAPRPEHEAATVAARGDATARAGLKPAPLPYGFDATRLAELIDVIIDEHSGLASLRAVREAGDLTPVDPDIASRPSEEIVQPVRAAF